MAFPTTSAALHSVVVDRAKERNGADGNRVASLRTRALDAWAETGGARDALDTEVIHDGRHSCVVRITRTGGRVTVVAKMVPHGGMALDLLLHEVVIPRLDVPSPRFLGFADGGPDGLDVLFLEDIGDVPYVVRSIEHRRAGARWLAALHGSAALSPESSDVRVPLKGPEYFHGLLEEVQDQLCAGASSPVLDAAQASALGRLRRTLAEVERRWDDLVTICLAVPATIVHGAFITRNVRVVATDRGISTIPFDWEHVAWASPALDLARSPDFASGFAANAHLGVYRRALARQGFPLGAADVRRLAAAGTCFRGIASMAWASHGLTTAHPDKAVLSLEMYERCLTRALRS